MPDESPQKPRPIGPFITAVLSSITSTVLLIVLLKGLKLTMNSVLLVVLPAMTTATMLIAISMGWIFLSIGRSKLVPRWIPGTAVFITITMLELLVLTYMTETK